MFLPQQQAKTKVRFSKSETGDGSSPWMFPVTVTAVQNADLTIPRKKRLNSKIRPKGFVKYKRRSEQRRAKPDFERTG